MSTMNQHEPEVWGPEAHEAIERELVRGTLYGRLRPELLTGVAGSLESLRIVMTGLADAVNDAFAKARTTIARLKEINAEEFARAQAEKYDPRDDVFGGPDE